MKGRVGSVRSNGVSRVKYSTHTNYYFILFIGIIKGIKIRKEGKRGHWEFSLYVNWRKEEKEEKSKRCRNSKNPQGKGWFRLINMPYWF